MKKNNSLIFCALLLILPSCSSNESGRLNIGTHSLYYEIHGRGVPAVIIDPGAGETFTGWQGITDSVASVTRTFVYDRAGYGRSDTGKEPRDGRTEASELHDLLKKTGVEPPYLLAGHSLGAVNMQVFAALYPDEVCGMVLLDPSPRTWLSGKEFPELTTLFRQTVDNFLIEAERAEESGDPEGKRMSGFFRTLASEHRELFNLTARHLLAITSFGDLPLTVIGSEIANPAFGSAAVDYQEFWILENQKLARLSANGRFILAANCTHHIPQEAPDLVAGTILDMVGEIRKTGLK